MFFALNFNSFVNYIMASGFREKMAIMKQLLDEKQYLNAKIVTHDGGSFRVHMEYVAGWSPFIKRAIFAAKDTPFESILIQSVSKDVMSNIINFMYTGQLTLSMNMVSEMAKAGRLLEIPYIVDFCLKHILANLNNENCVKIYMSPEYRNIDGIKEEIIPYILRHFQQVKSLAQFLRLNFLIG